MSQPAPSALAAQALLARAIPGLPRINPLHPRRWTPLRVHAFLVALDATGSVEIAARAAGMSRQSAYRLRARRPEIAALWRMAWRAGRGLPERPPGAQGGLGVTRGDAG